MISKVCSSLGTFIVILEIILFIPLVIPKLFGIQIYGILTDSMEPVLPVGSAVYVKEVNPSEIVVNDIIAFHLAADSGNVATHRVIEINTDQQEFITKGDFNDSPDVTPVSFERLIGKEILCIPNLGIFSKYLQTGWGVFIGISGLVIAVILWIVADISKKRVIK